MALNSLYLGKLCQDRNNLLYYDRNVHKNGVVFNSVPIKHYFNKDIIKVSTSRGDYFSVTFKNRMNIITGQLLRVGFFKLPDRKFQHEFQLFLLTSFGELWYGL